MTTETVNESITNIEKWQKLLGKTIKQTKPIVDKNIDLTFMVVETIAKQYKTGGKRMKNLLGIGGKTYKKTTPARKANTSTVAATQSSKVPTPSIKESSKVKTKKVNVKGDLKEVSGIGPKIEKLLNAEKIFSLTDLANANISVLNKVLDTAGPRFQMHDSSTWVSQAKMLIKG